MSAKGAAHLKVSLLQCAGYGKQKRKEKGENQALLAYDGKLHALRFLCDRLRIGNLCMVYDSFRHVVEACIRSMASLVGSYIGLYHSSCDTVALCA